MRFDNSERKENMGTNYYLLLKANFNLNKPLPATLGCGECREPLILENGFVYHNTYYETLDNLNKVFYQKIHIGKSSLGWRFSLCIYPAENPKYLNNEYYREYFLEKEIKDINDWIVLFNDKNNIIIDEYGDRIDANEMIDIITKRIGNMESDKNGRYIHDPKLKVVNGLIVHSSEIFDSYLDHKKYHIVLDKEFTYDYVISGNNYGSEFS